MSRSTRKTVALAALTGLVGTTALGAVTALHVLLEHESFQVTAAHVHHSGASSPHAHPHQSELAATGHTRAHAGEMNPGEAPGHNRASILAADLQARSDRLAAGRASATPAEAPCSHAEAGAQSPLRPPSRASPAARTAPLARRSVVLQG